MTKVLVDANIVLDCFLSRPQFLGPSVGVWSAIELGYAEGFVSAHAVTTIAYVARKIHGAEKTRHLIDRLLLVFRIATVNYEVLSRAVQTSNPDFEDAVTSSAAHLAGCDLLVTRDPGGFRDSPVRAVSPTAFLAMLNKP